MQRKDSADTDNNASDFAAAAPTPGAPNAGGGGDTGSGEPGPLRIHDIQGSSWLAAHNGDAVTNVPGIVTGIRTAGSQGLLDPGPEPRLEPGHQRGHLRLHLLDAPAVAVGDSVLVSGTVRDFYPLSSGDTVGGTSNLSVTEIGSPTVIVLSHGNPLPAPVVIGARHGARHLRARTSAAATSSRRRSRPAARRSTSRSRARACAYRSTTPAWSARPTTSASSSSPPSRRRPATYRGGTEILAENAIPSGRVEVVPADGANPGVDVGDVLQGATVGPIDYSQFGGYLIAATTLGSVQHNHLPPVTAAAQSSRQLAVATYNVENLAPGDPASKYQRLAEGVVTNLSKPDIVALEEIQDNTGATDDGIVAADQTLTKFTDAIVAAGGPRYQWREIDPVNDQDGGQPGGNIRVVFLFNPARVSFVDRGSSSVNRSTTGTAVVKSHGDPALTLSPGRVDPSNPVWTTSRKPLAGEFRFRGDTVFVIANHFDSKGGDQNADGRFQFPAQSSAVQRAGQAQVVHDFVEDILDVDRKADVVVLGDLNDFQFSPSVAALRTGTADGSGSAILTDLISTLPEDQQYTYVFNGVSQVLDHILVTRRLGDVEYQVVHVNAEYADQASDHDPQVVRLKP